METDPTSLYNVYADKWSKESKLVYLIKKYNANKSGIIHRDSKTQIL